MLPVKELCSGGHNMVILEECCGSYVNKNGALHPVWGVSRRVGLALKTSCHSKHPLRSLWYPLVFFSSRPLRGRDWNVDWSDLSGALSLSAHAYKTGDKL
ncbi:hypothetical protein CEXT_185451 [Caerostris extrusa]|uniref:Uncharacterized protein n=1 Tax=Caerostris extrusa TaxID=172846 RepID=A0AAV4NBF8_CAEEX|nr:hypothetical protein CEXT_185451 [Caerostris extrusa]